MNYKADTTDIVGFGRSYYIGDSAEKAVKLDLFYSDPFIRKADNIDTIRVAHVDDVIAMKIDVISRGGRKKDFWDIHYLLDFFSLKDMIALHQVAFRFTSLMSVTYFAHH